MGWNPMESNHVTKSNLPRVNITAPRPTNLLRQRNVRCHVSQDICFAVLPATSVCIANSTMLQVARFATLVDPWTMPCQHFCKHYNIKTCCGWSPFHDPTSLRHVSTCKATSIRHVFCLPSQPENAASAMAIRRCYPPPPLGVTCDAIWSLLSTVWARTNPQKMWFTWCNKCGQKNFAPIYHLEPIWFLNYQSIFNLFMIKNDFK